MKKHSRKILAALGILIVVAVISTCIINYTVDSYGTPRTYTRVTAAPYHRVALLLGTSPYNRYGGPNTYFTQRMRTAAALYKAGKIDYIIASGDNRTKDYDEPTAMRNALIGLGVPADRIIPDYAGFRTLDSVVRAKEVFGCSDLTIISQADHCARALWIARANGIEAIAVAAPVKARRLTRVRMKLREWLARDKMMLDIWFGKRPHFLGERIEIPKNGKKNR